MIHLNKWTTMASLKYQSMTTPSFQSRSIDNPCIRKFQIKSIWKNIRSSMFLSFQLKIATIKRKNSQFHPTKIKAILEIASTTNMRIKRKGTTQNIIKYRTCVRNRWKDKLHIREGRLANRTTLEMDCGLVKAKRKRTGLSRLRNRE